MNQYGLSSFAAKSRATTEIAVRPLLLVLKFCVLFVEFINPQRHMEAKRGCVLFLRIAGRLVDLGHQKGLQIYIRGEWTD